MTNIEKELNKAKYDLTSYQVEQIVKLFEKNIYAFQGKKLKPADLMTITTVDAFYSMVDRGDGKRCAWCDKLNPSIKHLEKHDEKLKVGPLKDWEKEFDQVFGATLWQEHKYKNTYKGEQSQYVSVGETVKDFIRQFLETEIEKAKEGLIEEIQSMKRDFKGLNDILHRKVGSNLVTKETHRKEITRLMGYNQAIDDVISSLKAKEDK